MLETYTPADQMRRMANAATNAYAAGAVGEIKPAQPVPALSMLAERLQEDIVRLSRLNDSLESRLEAFDGASQGKTATDPHKQPSPPGTGAALGTAAVSLTGQLDRYEQLLQRLGTIL